MSELDKFYDLLDSYNLDPERCTPSKRNPGKAAAALGVLVVIFAAAGWGAKEASETHTVGPTLSRTAEEKDSLKSIITPACKEQAGPDGSDIPASIDSVKVFRGGVPVSMIYDGPIEAGDTVIFDCTSFQLTWLNNRNPLSAVSRLLHN